MSTIDLFTSIALPMLKQLEGGYTNDPDDPGGETNHGVTIKVARAFGYFGPMVDLPYETAVTIFWRRYWKINRLDDVALNSDKVALEMFEAAVHVGPGRVAVWFQEWLNALNRGQVDYDDIVEDGLIGNMTLYAYHGFGLKRGMDGMQVLLNGLNASQACYYKSLNQEKYLYGWMAKRVGID